MRTLSGADIVCSMETLIEIIAGAKAWLGLEPWQWAAIARMLVASAVGAAVGLEREVHGRAAGLRTQILVCLGCCIVMLASLHFPRLYEHLGSDSVIRLDPARLAYGVVAGIGFLGAGVIMKQGLRPHGLTTAASLWCTGAVGLSVGMGMYIVAGVGAVIMLFTLLALRAVDRLLPSHHYMRLTVSHHQGGDKGEEVLGAIAGAGGTVLSTAIDYAEGEGMTALYTVRTATRDTEEARRRIWREVMERCPDAIQVKVE